MMIAAYAWLAADHGRLNLWHVTVHENGKRTLADTMLYFPHFLREVPTDVAMALFVLMTFDRGLPVRTRATGRLFLGVAAIAACAVLVVAAFAATAASDGVSSALLDFGQYRTRDATVGYGSHWHYHWLSTLWFGIAAGLASSFLLGARRKSRRVVSNAAILAWGYFLVLTLVFGLTRDVFFSPLYAGHQAREIATHGAITLPLAFGCLRLATGAPPARPRLGKAEMLRFAALLAIGAWLVGVTAQGDVMAEGQSSNGLSAMVAGHIFEHSLDYLAIMLLVSGVALLVRRDRAGSSPAMA